MSAPPEVESFIAQVTRAFGDPLPDWLLGVGREGRRFTILVEEGYLQHPKVVEVVRKMRAKIAYHDKETLSVEERPIAKARKR